MDWRRALGRRVMLAVVVGVCGLAVVAGPAWAGPRLVIDDPVWEVGRIAPGEKRERVFALKNAGDAPLVISRVRVSCPACTEADLSAKTIPPGGSANLRLSFRIKPGSTAPERVFVMIHSNDPTALFHRIRISAEAATAGLTGLVPLVASPLDIGVVWKGEVRSFLVAARNADTAPLRISRVAVSKGLESLTAIETVAPGAAARWQIQVRPEVGRGPIEEWVRIYGDDETRPLLRLRVVGYASGSPAPAGIDGVVIAPAGDGRWTVTNRLAGPVAVAPVGGGAAVRVAPGASADVRAAPTATGGARLRVDLPPQATGGDCK